MRRKEGITHCRRGSVLTTVYTIHTIHCMVTFKGTGANRLIFILIFSIFRTPTLRDGSTAVSILVVVDVLYVTNLGESKVNGSIPFTSCH